MKRKDNGSIFKNINYNKYMTMTFIILKTINCIKNEIGYKKEISKLQLKQDLVLFFFFVSYHFIQ